MRREDVERYLGKPYCAQTMDCADLVVLVQRELFGREVVLPSDRPRGARGELALGEMSRAFGARTDSPRDGDFVLMRQPGGRWHVGVYFFLAHEPRVLHVRAESVLSELTPVRNLSLPVEGYYAWA